MSGFSGLEVIDPDAIARNMPPAQAAREALRRRRLALLERRSFRGRDNPLRHRNFPPDGGCSQGRTTEIVLHYVSLGSPEHALDRIRNRVALGGHDVPENDARRRFLRSHSNLPTAAQLADEVLLYDNSLPEWPHRVVAIFNEKTLSVSDDVPDWAALAADAMMLRAG